MQTEKLFAVQPIEQQIAKKLNKLGYKTEINLGNSNSKISVAVYDKRKDKFVLEVFQMFPCMLMLHSFLFPNVLLASGLPE